MNRRRFLTATSGLTLATIAGCVGSGSQSPADADSTTTATTTTPPSPQFDLRTFKLNDYIIDGKTTGAILYMEDESGETYLTARATIKTPKKCYKPVFEGVTYDATKDAAILTVSMTPDESGSCSEWSGPTDWDGAVEFVLDLYVDGHMPKKAELHLVEPEGGERVVSDWK